MVIVAGNVWADFSSAAPEGSTTGFPPFMPPPPPAAGSVVVVGGLAVPAATDMGGDELFGGFQAANPPAAAPATGTANPLDAVAAAFAATTPQAATTGKISHVLS